MPDEFIRDIGDGDGGGPSPDPPPSYESTDWDLIGNLAGDVTGYVSASLASTFGAGTANLNGTYPASDVSPTVITLGTPETVNPDWTDLTGESAYVSPSLATNGEGWVGPFVVDLPNADTLVLNITAPQGMYKITKKGKDRPQSTNALVEVTPVDSDGNPTGAPTTHVVSVYGDGKDKAPKGKTIEIPKATGRYRVRVRRTSPKNLDTEDTIVDEIKWRDLYGTALITQDHLGDVTLVHSRTFATSQATGQKERKLTCRATRKVLQRNEDNTFGPELVASNNAADIICHMVLDPFIGGRPLGELDVGQIYDTMAEVAEYFGIEAAAEFGYTFDQSGMSLEEMVQTVAGAVFCTAYRQGSKFRLFFERENDEPVLLLNHRAKVPGSEVRSVRFGYFNDHDGVELDYVSLEDGITKTVYRPEGGTATKPKKMERIGVQDVRVANLHLDRAWARIKYQHTTAEVEALPVASQLVRNQRIDMTDNTRPDVFDGQIMSQLGLTLTLSQPFTPLEGVAYSIFLQRPTGGVEPVLLTSLVAGVETYTVTLADPPSFALQLGPNAAVATHYQITGDAEPRGTGFLVTDKGVFDGRTVPVKAINYDARYYAGDGAYRD